MTRFCYVVFFSVLAVCGELLFRNLGLFFPFSAMVVFYLTTAFHVRWACLSALLCASALDIFSGASDLWSLSAFACIIILSWSWLHEIESDSLLFHMLPGVLLPLPVFLCDCLFLADHPLSAMWQNAGLLFLACFFSMLLLPLFIVLMDTFNEHLGLDLYVNAKLKLKLHEK